MRWIDCPVRAWIRYTPPSPPTARICPSGESRCSAHRATSALRDGTRRVARSSDETTPSPSTYTRLPSGASAAALHDPCTISSTRCACCTTDNSAPRVCGLSANLSSSTDSRSERLRSTGRRDRLRRKSSSHRECGPVHSRPRPSRLARVASTREMVPNTSERTTRTAERRRRHGRGERARRCWRMSSPSRSSLAIPCIGAARSATAARNRLLRRSRSVSLRAHRRSRWRGSSRTHRAARPAPRWSRP